MSIFSNIQKVEKLSPRLRNLYLHKIIYNTGGSLIGIFGPIFLYELSGSLKFVLIFYGLIRLLYVIFLPLCAKLLKRASMNIFMIIGVSLSVVYFAVIYFLAQAHYVILSLIILLILVSSFQKLFYWIPYHIDLARFMDRHHRGRQFSFLGIFITLLAVILPIFSGFIISRFGFPLLFILATIIISVSILPLFFLSHTREEYSFSYFESFKKLFSKKHIKTNLAYFADGFQDSIGFIIWPIFIFMLLQGKYLDVGLLSAGIILISCVLKYAMGETTDRFNKKKLVYTGSILYALGWVFKAIVITGWQIFLAGVYHNFTKIIVRTPFDVLMYEIAADQGHYIDEFTVLRDMSLNSGRVLMVIFSLILLSFVNMAWIFILGGIFSLLLNLVSKEEFVY